jgi:NAD(P)-dependent dehydrogenase (short-subunit alcohol dehydrogenase family)
MNINGKRVLVTGGSSGIGLALAHAFLANGAKVVITGRRPDALAKAVQELRENYSHVWSVAATPSPDNGRWRWTNRMAHRILVIEKESRMTQLTTQRCAPSIAERRRPRAM